MLVSERSCRCRVLPCHCIITPNGGRNAVQRVVSSAWCLHMRTCSPSPTSCIVGASSVRDLSTGPILSGRKRCVIRWMYLFRNDNGDDGVDRRYVQPDRCERAGVRMCGIMQIGVDTTICNNVLSSNRDLRVASRTVTRASSLFPMFVRNNSSFPAEKAPQKLQKP